jgi:hypothetical protein
MAPIIPRDSVPPLEVKNSTCFESFNSIPLLRDEEDGSDESDVDEGVDSGDFDDYGIYKVATESQFSKRRLTIFKGIGRCPREILRSNPQKGQEFKTEGVEFWPAS